MRHRSLLEKGKYSPDWIRGFYDQTSIWWGPDSEIPEEDQARAQTIKRLCGPGAKRVLELGCGAGHTAAATAALGHRVVAVDLSPSRIRQAVTNFPADQHPGLTFIEGDFYEVQPDGKFDVVSYWDGFGVQTDADHQRLFRRAAEAWLVPGGSFLVEVANTAWAVRHAGEEMRLDPLPGVAGSVEMLRRWYFDGLHGRWIDEWVPVQHPEMALAQTIRCYTPADFKLLVAGTGLVVHYMEINGQMIDTTTDKINLDPALLEAYSYLVQLVAG
jgi:SAM-dependent methyltransferase